MVAATSKTTSAVEGFKVASEIVAKTAGEAGVAIDSATKSILASLIHMKDDDNDYSTSAAAAIVGLTGGEGEGGIEIEGMVKDEMGEGFSGEMKDFEKMLETFTEELDEEFDKAFGKNYAGAKKEEKEVTKRDGKKDPRDDEIARLKAELAAAARTNQHLTDEVLHLNANLGAKDAELQAIRDSEALHVPEGHTFESYFEHLESRIAGFETFLKDTDYVVRKQKDSHYLECRKCRTTVNRVIDVETRLDPHRHSVSCPLHKALTK